MKSVLYYRLVEKGIAVERKMNRLAIIIVAHVLILKTSLCFMQNKSNSKHGYKDTSEVLHSEEKDSFVEVLIYRCVIQVKKKLKENIICNVCLCMLQHNTIITIHLSF